MEPRCSDRPACDGFPHWSAHVVIPRVRWKSNSSASGQRCETKIVLEVCTQLNEERGIIYYLASLVAVENAELMVEMVHSNITEDSRGYHQS